MGPSTSVELLDLEATDLLGQRLAKLLFPGAVIALMGPLGAGKTFLVRAIAAGLGVREPGLVTSPTFVLIQEYIGRLPVYHFDAYRLENAGEFWDLGIQEYFEGEGVSLIEWADKVQNCLPAEHLSISLVVTGPSGRRAVVQGHGARYDEIVSLLS
jgi:tRNA threonylcarbamoyladenosine biosynthesis protein TsaE